MLIYIFILFVSSLTSFVPSQAASLQSKKNIEFKEVCESACDLDTTFECPRDFLGDVYYKAKHKASTVFINKDGTWIPFGYVVRANEDGKAYWSVLYNLEKKVIGSQYWSMLSPYQRKYYGKCSDEEKAYTHFMKFQ